MDCPRCRHGNPDAAKFCANCGTELRAPASCTNCRAELPVGARFCTECGTRVAATPTSGPTAATPAPGPLHDQLRRYIPDELLSKLETARDGQRMHGERRVVTMLFCDLQGSTTAAEELDPEDWADIINGAFEHLIRPVYEYEGTLARLMGDAILAFFGAPIAHEDDPERAVLAALGVVGGLRPYAAEVARRWGIDLDVRVGIHTGLVVVGEMGSDLRLEYTAMGDAVNLAARLEQTAQPGAIQISADTQRLVDPFFVTEDLGEIEVKGRAEPVHTYRVLGRRAERGDLRGVRGLASAMVGREAELGELRAAVDELQSGRGAVLSVMAEAGLGKSRLVRELRAVLQAEGRVGPLDADPPVRWEQGRCQSYTTGTPYTPFRDLLGSCFSLAEFADDEARRDRVYELVGEQLGARAPQVAPYIAHLLDLPVPLAETGLIGPLQPPELRQKVFEAVAELLAGLAADRPLVVVLEDLHWADSTSIDLLEHLLGVADQSMLLLIALFRPRRVDPSWRFHELATRDFPHRYRAVELRPLPDDDSRLLVGNLLHIEGLPEPVRALIVERSEGNPLFVEEVIRSLIDTGAVERDGDTWHATREIDDVRVPDSLAALITTRLDRLDDPTKLVAYTAAVVGRSFDQGLLEVVLDDAVDVAGALHDLERRELVRETARVPTHTYRFTHALTRQTAYDSALVRTRRDLHRRLAEHLQAHDPDAVQDLARHWMGADEPVIAIPYLVAAGAAAFAAYAIREALHYLREATSHICDTCATEAGREAWELLAQALTFSGDIAGANDAARHLVEFGTSRADDPSRVAGLNKMAFTQLFSGSDDEAFASLEQACAIATDVGDGPGLAEANMYYCFVKTNRGDLESALANQQESMRLGVALDNAYSQAFGLVHYANTLLYLTRFEESAEAAGKAHAFCEETGFRHFTAELLAHTDCYRLLYAGRIPEAVALGDEGTELAASVGAGQELGVCMFSAMHAHMAAGQWDRALDLAERTLTLGLGAGLGMLASGAASALAVIHHNLGHHDLVESYSQQAIDQTDMPVGKIFISSSYAEIGWCALLLGEAARARDHFEHGLASRSATTLLSEPMLEAGLGLVALLEGDPAEAAHHVGRAQAVVEAKQMRSLAPFISLAHGQLLVATGAVDDGIARLAEGEADSRAMGMLPMAETLGGALADALAEAGRHDEASAALARHDDAIQRMAAGFGDAELAAAFSASALAAGRR